MNGWESIWPQVSAAVRSSRTKKEALEKVSAIRGPTTWDALARAWRRRAEEPEAHEALGKNCGVITLTVEQLEACAKNADAFVTAEELMDMDLKLPKEKPRGVGGKPTCRLDPLDGEKWLIPGDIHFGIQDDCSLRLMQECAEDFGVNRAILQGDTFDCYAVSRHDQRADRIRGRCYTLAEEREEGREFLAWVAGLGYSYMLPGNHEDRTYAVADKNPGLHGSLDLRTIFDIPKGIEVLGQFARIQAGSLVIEHGHKLPGSLQQYGTARVLRDHPDQTTIFGHTHRIAEARQTTYDRNNRPRTRMALTIGHLSHAARHVDYAPDANWQQGFALVEFWRGREGQVRFTIYVIEIHDHEFKFNGKVYR